MIKPVKKYYRIREILVFALTLSVLLLSGCGGGGSAGEGDQKPDAPLGENTPPEPTPPDNNTPPVTVPTENPQIVPTEQVSPLRPEGPYAGVLKSCALADYKSPCKLSTLPYIGHDTQSPTVEDILNRTLVTHEWMGRRLGELLQALPQDLLGLFRPVTSVVIGSEVRPSSFWPSLGSIRIDPAHLWLTVEEKRTVSTAEDFRSEFGTDLQFVSFWRMMLGDEYAIPYFSLEDSSERTLQDILINLARPLYHELAHANDDMRADNIAGLSLDLTPWEAIVENWADAIAPNLYADQSLTVTESELYELVADYVGSVFANEGKATFYGYSTIYEDVATLFAQFMMKYHFGIETHVAFMNKPEGYPDAECKEYLIAWGSRNRLVAPLVAERAKWVVEQMIGPSADLDDFFANRMGEDVPLRVGDNWCDSRFSDPVIAANRGLDTGVDNAELLRREKEMFRNH